MTGTVGIIGNSDGELQALVAGSGMRPLVLQVEQLASTTRTAAAMPEALLVDVRRDRSILAHVGAIKRRFPSMGIAIIAKALDPELMVLITPRLVKALDPDEVPDLPTDPTQFLQEDKPAQGAQLEGGSGTVDAPSAQPAPDRQ